ncbi:sensor histidine kinase [Lewinella sp. LCG006]|uniref:sensor histidine kinase n=1 Tax=Lewinella sp. LCG006 TaxID=3231911 RepID=UPI0034616B24
MKFGLVLALMGISTLALMGVQVYWLKEQYQQQQHALYRDAQKGIGALNQELNRRNSFVSQLQDQNTYDFQTWSADSSRLFIFASNVSDQLPHPDTTLQLKRKKEAQALADQVLQSTSTAPGIFETILLRSVQQCSTCEPDQSLGDRYPIDQLLAEKLKEEGVHLPFVAGLYQQGTSVWKHLYPTSSAVDTMRLAASPLNLLLMGQEEALYVYFPGQRVWIFKQLWLQLLVSVLLVMIIFGSFYYAWRIINRQKKLSEMKNDFINNMTHEFKTPIATIAFAVANINNEQIIADPDLVRQFTGIIKNENQRLNSQVEKVMNAALTDEKALALNWEATALYPLFSTLAAAAKLRIEENGGHLQLEINDIKGVTWLTDPFHLANVINNLLDNAIKYAGAAPPNVLLKATCQQEELHIAIKDSGIGISKEDLPMVFDKFYRAPTGDLHNVKGFGLGLSYVEEIIRRLGGSVNVKSVLGKGSVFSVVVPQKQA